MIGALIGAICLFGAAIDAAMSQAAKMEVVMNDAEDEAEVAARREVLILLAPGRRDAVMPALRKAGRVSATASPRLVVLDRHHGEVADIRAIQGVLFASDQAVELPLASETLASRALDEAEMLFVAAWNARHSGVRKRRSGEGLDWDAEGFEAPAPPAPSKSRD